MSHRLNRRLSALEAHSNPRSGNRTKAERDKAAQDGASQIHASAANAWLAVLETVPVRHVVEGLDPLHALAVIKAALRADR